MFSAIERSVSDISTVHQRNVMIAEHKMAVVTGSSRGIGAGIVRGLLKKGDCVFNYRSITTEASASTGPE